MTLTCTMILGDCLEVMPTLQGDAASLCIADLPYGVTGCAWDKRIDLHAFWRALYSACSSDVQCIAHATQPFATDLIASNRNNFRYDLIWQRQRIGGFFNAKNAPLRSHEHLLLFGPGRHYTPQMIAGKKYSVTSTRWSGEFFGSNLQTMDRNISAHKGETRFPKSVMAVNESDLRTDTLNGHQPNRLHVTQKPLELAIFIVRSFSDQGATVIDPTSGSATVACASVLSGRSALSVESDPVYFATGLERLRRTIKDNNLDVRLKVRR